jgi:cytochrome c-type biogenesis protein CcmE
MTDPRKQRRLWFIVGGVIIAGFLAYGATSYKSMLTPYVSFDEAMRSGDTVQVAGQLVAGSTTYVESSQLLSFMLSEEDADATMPVLYAGVRPSNFEEATQIVAIGTFKEGAFQAEQLLVKCPSKYQGVDQDPNSHSS